MLGIDVSHHNGSLNWDAINSQIDFAIIRCGYGGNYPGQDDTQFSRNLSECKRLGIPYGVYLYSYADSVSRIESELAHFDRLLADNIPPCGVWLDLEEPGCETFFETAATYFTEHYSEKYICGIYANKYHMTNYLKNIPEKCKRWVAHWNTQVCGYENEYLIWQYTSDGTLYGNNGRFDLNNAIKFWKDEEPSSQTLEQVAYDVIKGKYGNGQERKDRIPKETSFTYDEVQTLVNRIMKENSVQYYDTVIIDTNSIVDALKSIKVPSSYAFRKEIAKANGINNYKGTAEHNLILLSLAKNGKLRRV